ncbi:hypothetical protein NIES4106_14170 [Fischerella sp. NIES-4106]|nr:hypothetical protein NIES4106_14170 [Fischerella sp. NIES-4106]
MKSLNNHLEVTQAQTRILLALWDLGGEKQEVKRTEVVDRAKRSSEKSGDYKSILQELEKAEVLKIAKKNKAETVFLTSKGLQMLHEGLKNPEFKYESNIGAKTANALLKWIREMDDTGTFAPANGVKSEVTSYEEFEKVALEVYDKLNSNYSLDNLVPIYRIRREVGERVSREHFNEWILEMQEKDILQLQGGSLPDSDPAKLEDSITTEISGLRCYAKRLK